MLPRLGFRGLAVDVYTDILSLLSKHKIYAMTRYQRQKIPLDWYTGMMRLVSIDLVPTHELSSDRSLDTLPYSGDGCPDEKNPFTG